jgi:hypothetical protein
MPDALPPLDSLTESIATILQRALSDKTPLERRRKALAWAMEDVVRSMVQSVGPHENYQRPAKRLG